MYLLGRGLTVLFVARALQLLPHPDPIMHLFPSAFDSASGFPYDKLTPEMWAFSCPF